MTRTVRQRVLALLVRQPGSSAAQIGRALRMSSAAVRHHLAILGSDGRIVLAGKAHRRGRGRPAATYRPSERLLGDNLAMISDSLLRRWQVGTRVGAPLPVSEVLANDLIHLLGDLQQRTPSTPNLNELVDALNSAHYAARWEAGAQGPRVLFGHCPYAAIIAGHPELCEMDRIALGRLMEADAAQIAKIDPDGRGATQCVFMLRSLVAARASARNTQGRSLTQE